MSTKSNFTICFTPYSLKILFSNTHILILQFSNGTIMVGNICNFLVMLIIIRTRQISNTACKILFQISFADFLVGSITQPLYMMILLFRETLCILELVHTFIANALVRVYLYTIGLLGVDRYIRIKYLAKFERILPMRRVYIIMFFLRVFSMHTCHSNIKKLSRWKANIPANKLHAGWNCFFSNDHSSSNIAVCNSPGYKKITHS